MCLKFIQIVILWVYYTIPFGFTLFWNFWAYIFNFLNYILWLRITDEGSVPEMCIWSISLIKSDLKWCIHLSRSLSFELGCGLTSYQSYPDLEAGDTQSLTFKWRDWGWNPVPIAPSHGLDHTTTDELIQKTQDLLQYSNGGRLLNLCTDETDTSLAGMNSLDRRQLFCIYNIHPHYA